MRIGLFPEPVTYIDSYTTYTNAVALDALDPLLDVKAVETLYPLPRTHARTPVDHRAPCLPAHSAPSLTYPSHPEHPA